MRQRGRPKQTHPRELVVSFRLTADAYHALQGQALRRGQTPGAWARAVVEHSLQHTRSAEQRVAPTSSTSTRDDPGT